MNAVKNYINECMEILRQVTWPTKNQAIRYTVITFAFCGVFGALLALTDFVFYELYDFIIVK